MLLAVRLVAGHTPSGNPQRAWLVIDAATGASVDAIDEGYEGSAPLQKAYPDAVRGPDIAVTKTEYHEMLRWAEEARRR